MGISSTGLISLGIHKLANPASERHFLKSDVVERVSHISNEQERDALAALEILKERFGEEEWSLKSGCLDSCKLRRPNFGAILTSKGEL